MADDASLLCRADDAVAQLQLPALVHDNGGCDVPAAVEGSCGECSGRCSVLWRLRPAQAIVVIACCRLCVAAAALARVRALLRLGCSDRRFRFDRSARRVNHGCFSTSSTNNRVHRIIGLLISLGHTLTVPVLAGANRNVAGCWVAQVHGHVVYTHITRYQNAIFAKALRGRLGSRKHTVQVTLERCLLTCMADAT